MFIYIKVGPKSNPLPYYQKIVGLLIVSTPANEITFLRQNKVPVTIMHSIFLYW